MTDIIREFRSYSAAVTVHDPNVDRDEAMQEYDLTLADTDELGEGAVDAVVLAVGNQQFRDLGAEKLRRYLKPEGVLFDVKYVLDRDAVDGRL